MHLPFEILGRIQRRTLILIPLLCGVVWVAACQPADVEPPHVEPILTQTATPSDAGSLLLIDVRNYPDHKIASFDLESETTTTLFEAPENGFVHQLDVDSSGRRIALSYSAPPSQANQAPFDRSAIYVAELGDDGRLGELDSVVGGETAQEYLFDPVWAGSNGEFLFFVRYQRSATSDRPLVDLMRYEFASGKTTKIAADGIWPRISSDGTQLVFIQVDPISLEREIVLADLDGGTRTVLVGIDEFFDLDSPHFSADDKYVYFSAVTHSIASSSPERTWWEILLGVQVASAHTDHNIPADWWRVPVDGSGIPEQMTSAERIITHGGFDSTGERLFFAAFSGVFSVTDLASEPVIEQLPIGVPSRYVIYID